MELPSNRNLYQRRGWLDAVLEGFEDVRLFDVFVRVEVGDGAGDFEDIVKATHGEFSVIGKLGGFLDGFVVHLAVFGDEGWRDEAVEGEFF